MHTYTTHVSNKTKKIVELTIENIYRRDDLDTHSWHTHIFFLFRAGALAAAIWQNAHSNTLHHTATLCCTLQHTATRRMI